MIIKSLFGSVLLTALLPLLLLAGCAGLSASKDTSQEEGDPPGDAETLPRLGTTPAFLERPLPAGMEFIPAPLSWPAIAPGIGFVTREREDPVTKLNEDEMKALTESFRTAYIEGRLRDQSLEGVLGGDFIHSWPPAAPLCRVQNWRDRDGAPNTWGIPSLVLAIRGMRENRVFTVRGDILNVYGKSAGRKGANGVAGYGAPLGEEFLYQDGIAQCFEHGLIYVDPAGKGRFIPGAVPSALQAVPETLGYVNGDDGSIRGDFQEAWKRGMNQSGGLRNLPGLKADGPVLRLDFSGTPWEIPMDGQTVDADTQTFAAGRIPVTALYYQRFNQDSVLFLLARIPAASAQALGTVFHTRIIATPFLEAFLAGRDHPLPGSDAPRLFIPQAGVSGLRPEDAPFHEAVLQGLARYGLPLTDAAPSREGDTFRETQRFSQGWMMSHRRIAVQ